MKKEFKQVGQIKPCKGHTVYSVDKETLEIKEAIITTVPMKSEKGDVKIGKKIKVEENQFYISALNKKNVRRKLIKMTKQNTD